MALRIAFVGATGAVGAEFLKILGSWGTRISDLRLLASARSAGSKLSARGEMIEVMETTPASFDGVDIAFLSASTAASKVWGPAAVEAGAVVIDDSSAFRLDPAVPLVVPEVNAAEIERHQGIISQPNCTTVPLVMALHPLRGLQPIKRVVTATYQAVSGAGAAAVAELDLQTERLARGKTAVPEVFPHQIAFNLIPAVDVFLEDGYSVEEWKMQEETRKILGLPALPFSATCVRAPVYQAHSMAAHVEFDGPVSPEEARNVLAAAPGVRVVDNPAEDLYPHPLAAANCDDVFVGRIRRDTSVEHGIVLWLSADNLRKGAALNMVQIAEELLARGLVKQP